MEYSFKEYIDTFVTQKLKDDEKDTRFKLDEYIQNKIDCFNDSRNTFIVDNTKITYFRMLSKHVHKHELALGKDLKYFTPPQVKRVISGIVSYSYMTKRSAYAAIAYYFNWCVIIKEISYNPCDSIDTTDLFEVNSRVAKSQYMPLEDFYLYLDSLECTDVEKMIYTLVRYGVLMNSVPKVKWSDVDSENMMLNTIVKNNEVSLPIDEEFVRRVNLAKQCKGRGDNKDGSIRIAYIDSGYIIKYKHEGNTQVPYLYGIIERVSKVSNVGKLDMGMLTKNRRYDFALEKYEENGVITMNDLRDILYKCGFSSTASQVSVLKKELKNIFDLNVKDSRACKPIDVIDIYTGEVIKTYKTAKLLTQNSKKDLGFYVDKAVAIKTCRGEREEFKGLTFRYVDYLYPYDSKYNVIRSTFFNKKIKKIKKDSKYKKRIVNTRTGQQKLKKQLLYLYKECCICGVENHNLLVASHIKPLKDCSLEESYDIDNGLLLCKMHDGLFDAGLISFDDNGKLLISRKLIFKDRKIIGIDKIKKIDLMNGNIDYIRWHRENIFKK